MLGQGDDHVFRLGRGNEDVRPHEAHARAVPTHQRFNARALPRQLPIHGLIVHLEFIGAHGSTQLLLE
ncbi:hypothetical protein D3C72_1982040 [compost metagenome]